jgi:hypothetical protein
MTMSKLDERLIDYRIATLATAAAEKIIKDVIAAHVESCPIGKKLNIKLAFAGGAVAAIGLLATVISIVAYFHKGG